jgi:putative protease
MPTIRPKSDKSGAIGLGARIKTLSVRMIMWKPELLAPAKNLERLKVAIAYGADAVYLGGQQYGLRARADNFTETDLAQGVTFAHDHGAKVYVTLNAFLHDEDLAELPDYCQFLDELGVDAVIVSDLGVMRTVKRSSRLAVHLSTQASCLNVYAAQFWKAMGAERIVVGRELSVGEGGLIQQQADVEIEMFVHGAMCMAYSGHCTISNFTAGRDSNRGGCIQSCRIPYQVERRDIQPALGAPTTLMSSKDLWGIYQIGAFFQHNICSLKIEGRMKSSFYVAMTCKAYRQAIDAYATETLTPELLHQTATLLDSIPHRDYTSGSLAAPAGLDSVYEQGANTQTGEHHYLGIVVDKGADALLLRLLEPLTVGDEIEIVPIEGMPLRWKVAALRTVLGEPVPRMRQDTVVWVPMAASILAQLTPLNVVRIAAMRAEVVHAV